MKREKINILQLVDGFRLGGAETKLLELIKHLDKDKNKITVCSLTSAGSLQRDFESVGVKVKVFPRKHRFDVTLIPTLVRFLRKERIDIVQTTLFYADILGVIAARIAAHAADIARGRKDAWQWDEKISRARARRDWMAHAELAIDPGKVHRKRRQRHPMDPSVCSMCGKFCSMKLFLEGGPKANKGSD